MVSGNFNNALEPMTRFAPRAFALALMVIAIAGADSSLALAQEDERPAGLFDLIFGGSERLGGERSAPTQVQALDRTAQAGAPDLVLRLERLEAQIRQLTGVIEQLQYRNQQLENQVRRMAEDGEARWQESGSKGSPRPAAQLRPQTVPAQSAPAAAAPPVRRGDAFDPTQNPTAPGAPRTLGSIGAAGAPAAKPGEMADAATGVPGSYGAPATLPPSQTPKDEFDLAYGYVQRRDYMLAEEGFRTFLSKYPNERLSGDATFWLGESLFQRQRFRDAAEAFLNVSTKFEGNARAPDALLRLGQSLAALGEKEAACASLGEVLRKFPRASAGVKQGVEREQKRVRC
jgi:tol-pal system protein YbgF